MTVAWAVGLPFGAVTWTLLNGSSASTAGKTTNHSSATTPMRSTLRLTILPGRPNGIRSQTKPYTSAPQRHGWAVPVGPRRHECGVHDHPLVVVPLAVARGERQHRRG